MAENPFDAAAHLTRPEFGQQRHCSASDMRHTTPVVESLSLEQQYAQQYRQQQQQLLEQYPLPSGPIWAPLQPSPTALLAPRGLWLRQMEQQRLLLSMNGRDGNAAAAVSPTSSVALMTRQTQQMHLDPAVSGHERFKGPDLFRHGSSECVTPATPNTPSVHVTHAEEADASRQLDKIVSDLAAMAAASASISPANFISDEILDMPTMDFKNFLTTGGFDDATITAFKAARRRKKNRIYAKGSRDRKDRRNSPSVQRSRSVSPAARSDWKSSTQQTPPHGTAPPQPESGQSDLQPQQNIAVKTEEPPPQSLLDRYIDAERNASQPTDASMEQ